MGLSISCISFLGNRWELAKAWGVEGTFYLFQLTRSSVVNVYKSMLLGVLGILTI
jgi:hypothetical protein